jgi:hypothetical protein
MAKRASEISEAAPVETIQARPHDVVVEQWFVETFHNRNIDPNETNRLIAAKDRLKALLQKA